MNTSSYLYGVGPLFKDSVIIQAWQEREGELKLTNSEVELWNERDLVKQDIGTRTAC